MHNKLIRKERKIIQCNKLVEEKCSSNLNSNVNTGKNPSNYLVYFFCRAINPQQYYFPVTLRSSNC